MERAYDAVVVGSGFGGGISACRLAEAGKRVCVLERGRRFAPEDFIDDLEIHQRHYAFLVSEEEFDEIFGRITARGLPFWADPFEREPGQINTNDGGRGVYWSDPNGHKLEIITVPYGGWPAGSGR